MKLCQSIMMILLVILISGCRGKSNAPSVVPPLREPVVEIMVTDEARRPIPTAWAFPGGALVGKPYGADTNGKIRLTAFVGTGLTVGAPRYEDNWIPEEVWQTNRFPVIVLKRTQQDRESPEPAPATLRR